MDPRRFDTWTRAFVSVRSRRAVVRLLAGSAAGGLLALLGLKEAAACRGFGKDCKHDAQCCAPYCIGGKCGCPNGTKRCHGRCIGKTVKCCPTKCDDCEACDQGVCTPKPAPLCGPCQSVKCRFATNEYVCWSECGSDQECCGDTCVAKCDPAKCQKCDEASKNCKSKCASGQTCCGGACVDTSTDAKNCGGCGKTCTDPMAPDCVNGQCQCKTATTCGWPNGSSNCCQSGVGTGVDLDGQCCCNGTFTDPAGKKHCACMAGDTCACADGDGFRLYCCAAGSCGDPSICNGC